MHDQEKYDICVQALKDYVDATGLDEVVVGLSGGIDSALVAAMCVDAFGAARVHGILLPGPYSSSHSVDDALVLAANLGISTKTIPIVEPYDAFIRVMAAAGGTELQGLAAENTQARCRMVFLMAYSNTYGWLMINTGNKSEAMMGYSTLYGDTAGAFAPMGGIYKTDVYALARLRNARDEAEGRLPAIPQNTLTKAPSAELSPDQEDERAMGIGYAELDKILIALFEEGKSCEDLIAQGFEREEVERIEHRVRSYAYKRALEPPFPQAKFY